MMISVLLSSIITFAIIFFIRKKMEFDVAVFKGTDLYQNLTQSQKEYTIKVLDDIQSYKAISESKLEISKEFGDRFRTGGE